MYYYAIKDWNGNVKATHSSVDNNWTFNGPNPGASAEEGLGWMKKCKNITCEVIVQDAPVDPTLAPENSTIYTSNNFSILNCPPTVSSSLTLHSGNLQTGIVYLRSDYSDPDADPVGAFVWEITYSIDGGETFENIADCCTGPNGVGGAIIAWDKDADHRKWEYVPFTKHYVATQGDRLFPPVRSVSPYINLSALPSAEGSDTDTGGLELHWMLFYSE